MLADTHGVWLCVCACACVCARLWLCGCDCGWRCGYGVWMGWCIPGRQPLSDRRQMSRHSATCTTSSSKYTSWSWRPASSRTRKRAAQPALTAARRRPTRHACRRWVSTATRRCRHIAPHLAVASALASAHAQAALETAPTHSHHHHHHHQQLARLATAAKDTAMAQALELLELELPAPRLGWCMRWMCRAHHSWRQTAPCPAVPCRWIARCLRYAASAPKRMRG